MKKLLILSLVLSALSSECFAGVYKGGGTIIAQIIGGIAIGAPGSGIYSGYTLAAGDNFNSSLSVVNIANPLNRYFPTIDYENGTRGTTGTLPDSYDSDPYNPGHQDSNQGVAMASNTIAEDSTNFLTLGARIENATETGKIGSGRTLVDGILRSDGYLTVSTPAIIEAYIKLPSGTTPSGWHPSFWIEGNQPANGSGQEWDFEANGGGGYSTGFNFNYFQHSGAPSCAGDFGITGVFDGTYHLFTFILTSSNAYWYVDDALKGTSFGGCDTTSGTNPYQIFFTNHIVTPNTIADWNATSGAPVNYSVQWYRVWVPNAQYPSAVIAPMQNLPTLNVNYNTSMSYAFPSAVTLWGAGVTDYCQALPFEDYEPGASSSFSAGYTQFPSGLSYSSRTLTGVTSDLEPGRIHTACMPAWQSGGGVGYTARGYINVGPHISPTSISYSNGAGSFSVYTMGNCGDLVPKTMTVTGLPSGLSFNSSTFLISGTATTGSYTITISVTNAAGQTATNNSISLTVGS